MDEAHLSKPIHEATHLERVGLVIPAKGTHFFMDVDTSAVVVGIDSF